MEAAFPLSICRSFEANAWRSDLCAHCFQSRQEHSTTDSTFPSSATNQVPVRLHDNGSRYQSLMTSYRHSPVAMTTPSPVPAVTAGILKVAAKQKKNLSVQFGDAEDVIIGYGGLECFEDDFDDAAANGSNDDDEDFCYTDEDRRVTLRFSLTSH